LANWRADRPNREVQRRLTLELYAQGTIGRHAGCERCGSGGFDDDRAMRPRQGNDAQDAADRADAVVLVDVIAPRVEGRPRGVGGRLERERLRGRARRPIDISDAMPDAWCAEMFAHQRTRGRIQEGLGPRPSLDVDPAADPGTGIPAALRYAPASLAECRRSSGCCGATSLVARTPEPAAVCGRSRRCS
jgi:hypothetical protein